jgi:type I restriction enzyme S subunit
MNTSELVGKSAFIHEDFPNIFLPDRLWQTEKTNIEHSVLWLSYNIGHSSFMNEISKISSGTSGSMKNISKSSFLELKSIKPPITVQNQFEERVKLIEFQKQQAKEALAKSELLFQGLLQQAFKGELA